MTRHKNPEAAAKEARIQQAIDGCHSGLYKSVNHAAAQLNVPPSSLHHRINGRQTRLQINEERQALTPHEESELVRWITQLTMAGYPPRHSTLRAMAEEI